MLYLFNWRNTYHSVGKSQEKFWKSILSFRPVGVRYQTQPIKLFNMHPLSVKSSPGPCIVGILRNPGTENLRACEHTYPTVKSLHLFGLRFDSWDFMLYVMWLWPQVSLALPEMCSAYLIDRVCVCVFWLSSFLNYLLSIQSLKRSVLDGLTTVWNKYFFYHVHPHMNQWDSQL